MSNGSEPIETSQVLNQSLGDGSTPQTSSPAQPKDQTSKPDSRKSSNDIATFYWDDGEGDDVIDVENFLAVFFNGRRAYGYPQYLCTSSRNTRTCSANLNR
ncbi:hypothetical protein PanWU01x14_345220 [Parasponia andersonii]|uniref:Uncharacterized protein n=1 Tax=Parasponia andersonii TaxID=3476 RepID=A0A2P5ACS5_PARAD|nr:hypothetical protein PanWU01x14_345220 [Parasponia andersonii]